MENLKLEIENRLKASRERRRAEAMAWLEQARKKMAEWAELRQIIATKAPAGVAWEDMMTLMTMEKEEKVTLSLVSLEWREAHKNERCGFLFDGVFPLLFHSGYLDVQDVLNFRPMSKGSKDSVDNCLSNVVIALHYSQNEDNTECLDVVPLSFPVLSTIPLVTIFNYWSVFHYSGQNPFFSRHLCIGGNKDDPDAPFWKDNQEYWRGMENLLRRWGTQIWHVMIQFDRGMTPKEVYRLLTKLLVLMPNLRSILLEDHKRDGVDARSEVTSISGPLKKEMRKCPLPELPHLAHIIFVPRLPAPIVHAMLSKYNRKLEEINGEHSTDSSEERIVKVFRTISNCGPPARFEGPFVSLVNLSLVYDVWEASALPDIFKNVNDCGSQLRRLVLAIENYDPSINFKVSEPILKSLSLELPHLETIRLFVTRVDLSSIDFLLPCRSLKQILLRYTKEPKEMTKKKGSKSSAPAPSAAPPSEVIQFTGYANRPYESNIWEVFPDLELVSVELTYLPVLGSGESSGRPPIQAGDNAAARENLLRRKNSNTKAVLYTREGFRKHQLKEYRSYDQK